MSDKETPSLHIPKDRWEEIGQDDPKSRLLITISINGLDMHLEAIQVTTRSGEQRPANPQYDDIWEAYQEADGSGNPFLTTMIGDRTYCLFAVPFSD